MITFTEVAAAAVKKIIKDEDLPEGTRLRVRVVGGGCSGFAYDIAFDEVVESVDGEDKVRPALKNDKLGDGDRLFESNGIYAVIDEMSLMYLAGTEIDYQETLAATGFKFINPNVSSACGCGNSFSV